MKKNLIEAPIDNKNLVEDSFEDDVFENLYQAEDHRKRGIRHLIGHCAVKGSDGFFVSDGYVDVRWTYGSNEVVIKLLAVCCADDWDWTREDIFNHYIDIFKEWESYDNGIVVKYYSDEESLHLEFFFDLDHDPDC